MLNYHKIKNKLVSKKDFICRDDESDTIPDGLAEQNPNWRICWESEYAIILSRFKMMIIKRTASAVKLFCGSTAVASLFHSFTENRERIAEQKK